MVPSFLRCRHIFVLLKRSINSPISSKSNGMFFRRRISLIVIFSSSSLVYPYWWINASLISRMNKVSGLYIHIGCGLCWKRSRYSFSDLRKRISICLRAVISRAMPVMPTIDPFSLRSGFLMVSNHLYRPGKSENSFSCWWATPVLKTKTKTGGDKSSDSCQST